MSLNSAKDQFLENAKLLGGNPSHGGDGEKYNLYHGLVNTVNGLQKIEGDVEDIKYKLNSIINFLNTFKK